MNISTRTFYKNSFLTLSRQTLSIFIGLALTVIIARTLGPEGQGMYALIILLPTMLTTFLNLGVGVSSVYYVSKGYYELESIIKSNIILAFLLSVIAAIIGLVIVLFYSEQMFSGVPTAYLFLILLLIPILFLNQFLQTIFQGKQDFKSFNLILLIGQFSNLLLAIILLLVFSLGLGAALISFILGHLVTLIIIYFLLIKKYSFRLLSNKVSNNFLKESIIYGLKAHLSNIMAFINYRADMFIISFFLGPIAVGLYVIAVNISERLWIVSQAVSTVLFPKISSLTNDEDKNKLTSMVCRNILFLSVIGGTVLIFISDYFILLFFGEDYIDSSQVLKFLLPGIILGSMARIISNDIAGRGKPELNMYVSIFTVATNIILNLILIPHYGINGAAIATSIAYSMNWIIKVIIFNKLTALAYKEFILIKINDFKLYKSIFEKYKFRIRKV